MAQLRIPSFANFFFVLAVAVVSCSVAANELDENERGFSLDVNGVVQDQDGNPILDATTTSFPTFPGDPQDSTRSNANGEFNLQVKSSFRNMKRVHAYGMVYKEGFGIGAFNTQFAPVRVTLRKAKPVRIRVRDLEGNAVAGAAVYPGMVNVADMFGGDPPESWRPFLTQKTNEEGIVDLTSVVPKELRSVIVRTEEWGVQRFHFRPQPKDKNDVRAVRLRKAGTVKGRFIGPDDKPVAGAEVFISSSLFLDKNPQYDVVRTNDDGAFEIRFPVGTYTLNSRFEVDECAFPSSKVVIKENETVTTTVKPVLMGSVTGRFVTDEGKPIAAAPVVFDGGIDRRFGYADSKGIVKLKLPAGEWTCAAGTMEVLGFQPSVEQRKIKVETGEETTFDDIVVKTGDILTGQVRGLDMSIPRIRIIIAKANDKDCFGYYDDTGKFELSVPRDTKAEDVTDVKVRFVDRQSKVVSTDPFVIDTAEPEAGDF